MKARKMSDELKKSVFYQIFPRAFTSEGTLEAAEKMLPEVREIGVTHVYLCPIFEMDDDMDKSHWSDRHAKSGFDNPKNPYRMSDYYKIDPEYGTDDDLLSFVRSAHKLGLKVLLDLVYLHCGPKAVFIKEHPDFILRDEEGNPVDLDWHFPGINFESRELREYLWRNMEYFVEKFDIDGYRCDVGDRVPLDFWIEGRKRIEKIKPGIVMLNEGVRGDFLVEGFDLDYSFGLNLHMCRALAGTESAELTRTEWQHIHDTYPEGGRCIRYMDNHDTASDSYNNRYERSFGHNGMEAGFIFMYTMDGVPLLYNGNEACDDARHSLWSNRDFGKLYINWENALTKEGKKRRTFLKKLAAMRKDNPAFYDGSFEWLENSCPEKVWSYKREKDKKRFTVIINTSAEKEEFTVSLAHEPKNVLISSHVSVVKSGKELKVKASPKGYTVFEY